MKYPLQNSYIYRIVYSFQFVDKGYIKIFPDIYQLSEKQLELKSLEGFGGKSIDNLLDSIEKSKAQPFHKVLFALGIRYVGSGVARKLSVAFNNIQKLKSATIEELENIDEIGPSISNSLVQYFSNSKNLEIIDSLIELGLKFEEENAMPATSNLSGLSFVVTGTLNRMSRDEAKEKIILSGGKFVTSLSKKTDFLVAWEKAWSKLKKAEDFWVEVLDIDEFLQKL